VGSPKLSNLANVPCFVPFIPKDASPLMINNHYPSSPEKFLEHQPSDKYLKSWGELEDRYSHYKGMLFCNSATLE
jgi:hypothetical protein